MTMASSVPDWYPLQVVLSLGNLRRRFGEKPTTSELEQWIGARISGCEFVEINFKDNTVEICLDDWSTSYRIDLPPALLHQLASSP